MTITVDVLFVILFLLSILFLWGLYILGYWLLIDKSPIGENAKLLLNLIKDKSVWNFYQEGKKLIARNNDKICFVKLIKLNNKIFIEAWNTINILYVNLYLTKKERKLVHKNATKLINDLYVEHQRKEKELKPIYEEKIKIVLNKCCKNLTI